MNVVVETTLSLDEVQERLVGAFGSRPRKLRSLLGAHHPDASQLVGSVSSDTFRVRQDRPCGALRLPVGSGRVEATPAGTRVHVDVSPAPLAVVAPPVVSITGLLIAWHQLDSTPIGVSLLPSTRGGF